MPSVRFTPIPFTVFLGGYEPNLSTIWVASAHVLHKLLIHSVTSAPTFLRIIGCEVFDKEFLLVFGE